MWVLPTYGRPGRCQEVLDSIIAAGVSTPGVVIVDGDCNPGYAGLRLPDGWSINILADNRGVCGVLNLALKAHSGEPWYGFITDDSLVRTPGWDVTLVRAAGAAGFANSGDGWQAQRRMHGAVVFGGDLLRALGWWAPPGLTHSFVDDAWETIARALGNWRHVPEVLVEHCHALNRKAEADATYRKAYASFEADRAAFRRLLTREIPDAIARAIPVAIPADPERQRKARARSRRAMIASPVARAPVLDYTICYADTGCYLQRAGIAIESQFVIGSSNLPRARNELVARFLASDCTDLIFIDDDMGWGFVDPEDPRKERLLKGTAGAAIERLLASSHPLIAAVGRKKVDVGNDDPEVWCMRYLEGTQEGAVLELGEMGSVEVAGVGTGLMKIERRVFEAMIAAHPDWKRDGHDGMSEAVKANYYKFFRFGPNEETEDMVFCERWRALDGKVWIDPQIGMSHVGAKAWSGAVINHMFREAEPMLEAAE